MTVRPPYALVPLLALGACQPPQSEAQASEHFVARGSPVCLGTLARAERELERISATHGLSPPGEIQLYWGEDAVAERCGGNGDAGGCAALRGDGVEVMATSRSLAHEIVHAVRMHHGRWGPALFEAGLAQALAFGGARGGGFAMDAMQAEPGPVALFDHEFDEPGPYITAGHFVAFVLETRGDALHRVMVGDAFSEPSEVDGEAIDTALRAELGPDLSQLEDEWRGTSRASYSFLGECADTQPIETPGDTAVFDGVHDCESSDETVGPIGAEQSRFTARRRCVVTVPGRYRIAVAAAHGAVSLYPGGCTDLPPDAPQGVVEVPAGDSAELSLGACEQLGLTFETEDPEPTPWELRVELLDD